MKTFKVGDKVRLLSMPELEALTGFATVPSRQLPKFPSWGHRNDVLTVVAVESREINHIPHYQSIVLLSPDGEKWPELAGNILTADYFRLVNTKYPTNYGKSHGH